MGTSWASGAWATNAWGVGTWADLGSVAAPAQVPRASRYRGGHRVNYVHAAWWLVVGFWLR